MDSNVVHKSASPLRIGRIRSLSVQFGRAHDLELNLAAQRESELIGAHSERRKNELPFWILSGPKPCTHSVHTPKQPNKKANYSVCWKQVFPVSANLCSERRGRRYWGEFSLRRYIAASACQGELEGSNCAGLYTRWWTVNACSG